MAREVNVGKDVVISNLHAIYGKTLSEASGDIWKVPMDKTDAEVYDKIKMIVQGEGVKPHALVWRLFTDVSGSRLAEQARRLVHPDSPKREEELTEHVEMWRDKMPRLLGTGRRIQFGSGVQDQRFEYVDDRQVQEVS